MYRLKKFIVAVMAWLSFSINPPLGIANTLVRDQVIDEYGYSRTPQLVSQAPQVAEGEYYVEVNNNIPYFTNEDITSTDPWIEFTQLDSLGRVGPANAVLNADLMPDQVRLTQSRIEPSGWLQANYDGDYLYNRSHLIGYQLIGPSLPQLNLMTGTRQFNAEGMLPFENFVASVIEDGLSVRYRVTPYFEDGNLLASGVFMEGFSIEDNGDSLCFNIYIPNVQEGISIDYATGESSASQLLSQTPTQTPPDTGLAPAELFYSYQRDGNLASSRAEEKLASSQGLVSNTSSGDTRNYESNTGQETTATISETATPAEAAPDPYATAYIGNSNTGKFHYAGCHSVSQMADHNKVYENSRDNLISWGYVPCKNCNP